MTNTLNEKEFRCKIKLPSRNRKGKDTSDLDPFFDVSRVNLFRADNNQEIDTQLLVRADNGEELGRVSRNYNLVTHKQASETILEFLTDAGIKHEVFHTGTASLGSSFFQKVRFPDLEFNASGTANTALDVNGRLVADNFMPYIIIGNSYNCTKATSFDFGLYRIRCANGNSVRLREQKLSFRHNKKGLDIQEGLSIMNQNVVRETLLMNLDKSVEVMQKSFIRLNNDEGNPYLKSLMSEKFSDRFRYMLLEKMGNNVLIDSSTEETEKGRILTIKGMSTPLSAYSLWNLTTEIATHSITNLTEQEAIGKKLAKVFQISA